MEGCIVTRVGFKKLDHPKWKYVVTSVGLYTTNVTGYSAQIVTHDFQTVATLNSSGLLVLHPGFAWNGPNCFPDIKTFMDGSAAHDALWQMIEEATLSIQAREPSDVTMREINLAAGMHPWIAWLTYFAVAWFGKPGV